MTVVLRQLLDRPEPAPWPRPDADVRWGVGGAFAVLAAAQVLAVAWAVVWAGLLYGSDLPAADEFPIWTLPLLNAGLWIGYFGGPILANRLTGSGPMVDFDLRASPRAAVAAAAVGVGCQLALLPALYWVLLRFVDADPGDSARDLVDRVDGGLDTSMLILLTVVLAPLIEEWFFRGMLLSALTRWIGPLGGAVGSSVVFALVHRELILLPGLFVFGLVLCWLTLRTGRIGVAVVAHLAFNLTTVVQLLVFT